MRLEIEKEALKKEAETNEGKNAKARIKDIEKEIAEFKEKTGELELKWKNEKELLGGIKSIKKILKF